MHFREQLRWSTYAVDRSLKTSSETMQVDINTIKSGAIRNI